MFELNSARERCRSIFPPNNKLLVKTFAYFFTKKTFNIGR